jgi:DNA-binding GntR family transcriptional regulator
MTTDRAKRVAAQILAIARREGLEPGARLVEQRLADALDVSRAPVRAGLKVLADTGFATAERNCGYVPPRLLLLPRTTSSNAIDRLPMIASKDVFPRRSQRQS